MKEKNKLSVLLILVVGILLAPFAEGQATRINYLPTSSEIANPERGWYDDYYSYSGGSNLSGSYRPLEAQELISNRELDNITIILRLFYLHEFLNEESVSEAYLSKMQNDFDSIRLAGVKCIIRFAYSASQNADVWDATPDRVMSHIESMRDVLSENADIIAGVQAGFIGAWGEWYYTENFAGNGYAPDETDQENRRLLVEALLDILPANISVQGRTPAIMRNIVQSEDPISEAEAFTGTIKARVGHHNDCFLANRSDYGTYENLEEDIAYLHESTKYTITGGETCDASNDYSNCENSVPRMKELHWTYLNRDYNKAVYDKWETEGCFDEINISLGYRISLDEATIPDSVKQDSILNLSFTFNNMGYAAPTQYKPIQIVLTHTLNNSQTILNYSCTNNDIRYWLPGEILLNGEVEIPDTLADGNYSMAIRFPDQDTLLAQNPAYSIQLANIGLWDAVNGINRLNHIILVGEGGEGELPDVPENLEAQALSETEIDLTWAEGINKAEGVELMRSIKEKNEWILIVQMESSTTSFTDLDLGSGTKYNYIIRSMNDYGTSSWSEISSATTLGVSAYVPQKQQSLTIYPNPLKSGNLFIDFPNESKKHIAIHTISGQKIFEGSTREGLYAIKGELLFAGLYIVSVETESELLISKLIVL